MSYPTRLTPDDPKSIRARYKIVRRDTMEDVSPGSLILSAAVENGTCLLRLPDAKGGGTQDFDFGPNGLLIVSADMADRTASQLSCRRKVLPRAHPPTVSTDYDAILQRQREIFGDSSMEDK